MMYTVGFTDGEHEIFGCLACRRTFVSKRAIGNHFERNPSHRDIEITGSDIESERTGTGDDGVRRGVARRRLLERLTREVNEHPSEAGDTTADETHDARLSEGGTEDEDERSR